MSHADKNNSYQLKALHDTGGDSTAEEHIKRSDSYKLCNLLVLRNSAALSCVCTISKNRQQDWLVLTWTGVKAREDDKPEVAVPPAEPYKRLPNFFCDLAVSFCFCC
jgi:hypothetical protein